MRRLFFVVIPLIVAYKLPWEKRDLGFAPKETKISLVFLGILVLLDTINFLSYPPIILLFVLVRKQSFESAGITLKNFKNSMLILIIPLAYLISCISLSHFSMRSIGVIAPGALIVGISEEPIGAFRYSGWNLSGR